MCECMLWHIAVQLFKKENKIRTLVLAHWNRSKMHCRNICPETLYYIDRNSSVSYKWPRSMQERWYNFMRMFWNSLEEQTFEFLFKFSFTSFVPFYLQKSFTEIYKNRKKWRYLRFVWIYHTRTCVKPTLIQQFHMTKTLIITTTEMEIKRIYSA